MKTTAEKIEVMKAFEEGRKIEFVGQSVKNWTKVDSPSWNWEEYDYRIKPESKYRPFKSIDELITYWDRIRSNGNLIRSKESLSMPLIWVKNKDSNKIVSIIGFDKNENKVCTYLNRYYDYIDFIGLDTLFNYFTFIDDSPCGVEE